MSDAYRHCSACRARRVSRAASGDAGRADHDHGSLGCAARQVGAARGTAHASSTRAGRWPARYSDWTSPARMSMNTGLVWDTGDADMTARPLAGSLVRAPWIAAPTGQLMLTMFDGTGRARRGRSAPCAGAVAGALRGPRAHAGGRLRDRVLSTQGRGGWPARAGGRRPCRRAAEDRRLQPAAARRPRAGIRRGVSRGRRAGTAGRDADVRVLAGPVRNHAASSRRRAARRGRGGDVQARGARRRARNTGCSPASWPSRSRARRQRPARARERERRARHQPVRERRAGGHTRAAPRDRRHAGDHGGIDGDICAQRQLVPPLRERKLRAGGADLGYQQSHR